jgi:hypothetical protein
MNSIRTMVARAGGLALATAALSLTPQGAQADQPLDFNPLPSCRLWDTQGPPGPSGGPKLNANTIRCFPVTGLCGVPTDARAASLNLTALLATDSGSIRAFPAGTAPGPTIVLNFKANGPAVANGAVVGVGTSGFICVRVDMPKGSTGLVHLVGDVVGYYTRP